MHISVMAPAISRAAAADKPHWLKFQEKIRRKNFETISQSLRRSGMSRTVARNFILVLLLVLLPAAGRANEPEDAARDLLVYKDGDRVHGRVIEQKDGIILFQSDRFGLQRVPATGAVVIKAEKTEHVSTRPPAASPVAAAPAGAATAVPTAVNPDAEARTEGFSNAVLLAKIREFFGPWKGRLAFSTEVVSDSAERSALSVEARLGRKWARDEVQLNARYDYSQTEEVTTTDMVKADGLWRHNFGRNSFAQYRPVLEWNRASIKSGRPADYVLLQQEVGAGISLLTKPSRKLRVGVSENLFDVWTTAEPTSHTSRTVESAFVETELRLPWALLLSDRGVYYYSLSTKDDGWENRIELTKKFTEAFSTAIRHETRQGSPDGTAQDYTRLRLLLGLDF